MERDGARKDLLRLCTHGPPNREGIDAYVTIGWDPLFAEVAKLKISLKVNDTEKHLKSSDPMAPEEANSSMISSDRVTLVLQSNKKASIIAGLESGGAGSRTTPRRRDCFLML